MPDSTEERRTTIKKEMTMQNDLKALRILVVEDDADTAHFVTHILTTRGGHHAMHVWTPAEALSAIEASHWDLMITDLHLPEMDGSDLIRAASAKQPNLPSIIITAYPGVEVVVDAMRSGASDFLVKPIDPSLLLAQVEKAWRESNTARPSERILAIGAHPDDVEIGIGGTLLSHRAAGDEVTILTMTKGSVGGDTSEREVEAKEAARLLGARLVMNDLIDTEIPDGMPTLSLIEELVREIQPTMIYTHSIHDLHQDHRAVHRATLPAARKIQNVFCYQAPSATVDFRPTRFVGIDNHLEGKVALVGAHASQVQRTPGLAADHLRATALYWGRFSDGDYAEPLEVIRQQITTVPIRTEGMSHESS